MRTLTLMLLCACSPTSGELSLLSYNVHGLPPGITGDDTQARLEQIGPLLVSYDLIGLQEVWSYDTWQGLRRGTDHPYIERHSDPLDEGRAYGAGLVTMSRNSPTDAGFTYFVTCNGVLDDGSDCLASKGFQRSTFELGGRPIAFFNSHLDAGKSEDDETARQAQVQQLVDAINAVPDDTAVVFTGDTNLHEGGVDAATVERWLNDTGMVDACEQTGCDDPGNIDKILIRRGDSLTLNVSGWRVEPWRDSDGVPLSDHEAIGVDLAWAR